MNQPLVTVVLTAYNHENYIKAAIESIFCQSYTPIELIIIDNASTDYTLRIVQSLVSLDNSIQVISNPENVGLCAAFNQGLAIAKGKYIIDFSGDDVMLSNRIAVQVQDFEKLEDDYIVAFSNASLIDPTGALICNHYQIDSQGKAVINIPNGKVYPDILAQYFICTPTMMMRTDLVKNVGGYDESLRFEDFDFWVRTSSKYKYHYTDKILTKKRCLSNSLGSSIVLKGSGILDSCYIVCEKAYSINSSKVEFSLLAARIRTFIRKCWYAHEFDLAIKFSVLLRSIEKLGWNTKLIVTFCKLRIPINALYCFYIKNFKFYKPISKDFSSRFVRIKN